MSSITTPDPDHTPPSGYRTSESRPDPTHASAARDLIKYIEDLSHSYVREVEQKAGITVPEYARGLVEAAFQSGYLHAVQDVNS